MVGIVNYQLNMKFSIIIPVYNAEQHIVRCIDSIIRQEYSDFEVILVDDGSSDKSFAICEQYAKNDDRFHTILKQNGGPGSARNEGLKHATGDYICFMDADDEATPHWLSNYFQVLSVVDSDIIFQNYINEDREGRQIFKNYHLNELSETTAINTTSAYNDCFKDNWVLQTATWSKCYKASIIKYNNITFIENIKVFEDFMFYVHVLNVASVITLAKGAGYIYHYNSSSLSRTKESRERMYEACNVIIQDSIWKTNRELAQCCLKFFLISLPICRVYQRLLAPVKNRFAKLLVQYKIHQSGLRSLPYNFAVTFRMPTLVKLSLNLQYTLFKK